MSIMRIRTLVLGIATVAATVSVAACSSGSGDSTNASQPVTTVVVTSTESPTTTPTPPSSSASSSAPTSDDASSTRCRAAELTGALAPAQGGASAGSQHYVLTLTNTGSRTCTTGGYPGVSFVGDGNGTQLGAPARRDGSDGGTVTLPPSGSARAALTVAQAGNFPACSPQTADGLRIYPPDDRDSLFVRTSGITACRSSAVLLSVGPLH
ncbi:DUF4232 domain-containing protein [Williamsia sp. SKLECPSW1]